MIFFTALLSDVEYFHQLLPRTPGEQHDNDETALIRFSVPRTLGRPEIEERGIFRIGSEVSLGHDPYGTTCLKQMSRIIDMKRELILRKGLNVSAISLSA